jgi:hypothetical protein
MRASLLGAFFGLVLGSVLGGLFAYAAYRLENDQPARGWTAYPTLHDPPAVLGFGLNVGGSPPLTYMLFQGILVGGGFGSLVGATSAATGVILRAVRQTKSG